MGRAEVRCFVFILGLVFTRAHGIAFETKDNFQMHPTAAGQGKNGFIPLINLND
jgi:hypothetical protein